MSNFGLEANHDRRMVVLGGGGPIVLNGAVAVRGGSIGQDVELAAFRLGDLRARV